MKNNKIKFWAVYHIGLLFFSLFIAMLMKYSQHGNALTPTVIPAFLSIFLMSVSIGYLVVFMINKAKSYTHKQLTKKILPALLIFYIFAYIIVNLSISLCALGWFLYTGRDLSEFWNHFFEIELQPSSVSFATWLIFFTISLFYTLWHKSAKREQLLIEENLKYKYNTLKSQINPHFLFNSLNTLSELIYSNVKKAENYLQKMSSVYRYVLDNEETDLITLDKELKFIESYFDMQKERDNNKISLTINIKNVENYKIIPVSLQLLIENALKHNSISREKPLNIKIEIFDDYIAVSNNIQRKDIIGGSTQKGLRNLSERVKLIMNKDLIIIENKNEFIVKMPIISRTA